MIKKKIVSDESDPNKIWVGSDCFELDEHLEISCAHIVYTYLKRPFVSKHITELLFNLQK